MSERPGASMSARPGSAVAAVADPMSARPTPAGMTAWRSFLHTHAVITRLLEAELMSEEDLPLASYDVLVQLAESAERRLRMTELAGAVLLSRSGLTRLVDRLVREGLVVRQPCEDDARGTYAVLTPAGLNRLRKAARVHLRGVAEHVTSRLREDELRLLSRLLHRLGAADLPQAPASQD